MGLFLLRYEKWPSTPEVFGGGRPWRRLRLLGCLLAAGDALLGARLEHVADCVPNALAEQEHPQEGCQHEDDEPENEIPHGYSCVSEGAQWVEAGLRFHFRLCLLACHVNHLPSATSSVCL